MSDVVLSVKNLNVSFWTNNGMVRAVRGISFDLVRGETLAIVGESGSGKSVSTRAILGILSNNAVIDEGSVLYEGLDLTKVHEDDFHRIRGHKIGMIFQDPLSSLNPIMRIGKQITEGILINGNRKKKYFHTLIQNELVSYRKSYNTIKEAKGLKNRAKEIIKKQTRILRHQERNRIDNLISSAKFEAEKKINGVNRNSKALVQKVNRELKSQIARLNNEYKVFVQNQVLPVKIKLVASYKKQAIDTKKIIERETPIKKAAKVKLTAVKKMAQAKTNEHFAKEQAEFITQIKRLKGQLKLTNDKAQKQAIALEIAALKESCRRVVKLTKQEAKEMVLKVMQEVGIPDPESRFKQFPFQFSGGMRQRIVIAIALTQNPEILICDEPTTALDVTIQSQILELINDLKEKRNMSVVFITHDLGVVANMADRVAVMYAGKIVESGTVNDIFYEPRHPYTWALLSAMPDLQTKEKLGYIPGTPPNMLYPPKGDAFASRNKYAMKIDFEEQPPMFQISDTHYAATWLLHPDAPKVEIPQIIRDRIKRMSSLSMEVNS